MGLRSKPRILFISLRVGTEPVFFVWIKKCIHCTKFQKIFKFHKILQFHCTPNYNMPWRRDSFSNQQIWVKRHLLPFLICAYFLAEFRIVDCTKNEVPTMEIIKYNIFKYIIYRHSIHDCSNEIWKITGQI